MNERPIHEGRSLETWKAYQRFAAVGCPVTAQLVHSISCCDSVAATRDAPLLPENNPEHGHLSFRFRLRTLVFSTALDERTGYKQHKY